MYRKILNNNKFYNKFTYSCLNLNKRLSIRFQKKKNNLVNTNLEKFRKINNLFKKHY